MGRLLARSRRGFLHKENLYGGSLSKTSVGDLCTMSPWKIFPGGAVARSLREIYVQDPCSRTLQEISWRDNCRRSCYKIRAKYLCKRFLGKMCAGRKIMQVIASLCGKSLWEIPGGIAVGKFYTTSQEKNSMGSLSATLLQQNSSARGFLARSP